MEFSLKIGTLFLVAFITFTQFDETHGSSLSSRCGGVCQNSGKCIYSHYANEWRCRCTRDYTGNFCQTRRNRCHSGTCKNGGHCICRNNVISCRCRDGFTGTNCEKALEATCILTQSSTISGTINIKQLQHGVRITGQIKGLPEGKHGFHVHQYADSLNGCASFGGHYNPFGFTHGGPKDRVRHVGDLGNILSNSKQISNLHIYDRQVSLVGKFNVFGRGFVIHAGEDDLGRGGDTGSLATGNAGGRLACCIIVHKA